MTKRPIGPESTRFDEFFGLSAYNFRLDGDESIDGLRNAPAHTHLELEIHFVESGAMTLEYASREMRLCEGEIVAFWGGIPHRDLDPVSPETIYHVAQVPIVEVLTWSASRPVLDRLLCGELLKSAPEDVDPHADRSAFTRWHRDLDSTDPCLRRAAEMEIEARLLRLLGQAAPLSSAVVRHSGAATAEMVARAIGYVTRHFMEPISVEDIATAVNRNHDHLMASFRHVCGLTLWEYVTRLRLSEAQRLLAATDLPILAVCHRSGFSGTSRMYDAFDRLCGLTPATYRQQNSR
jgi:AraC-like DNA-binding protein